MSISRKDYLELFWSAFPWQTCKSTCRSRQKCVGKCDFPKSKKLELLCLAVQAFGRPNNSIGRKIKRQEFGKGRKKKRNPKRPCFVCGEPFEHRHHIIPLNRDGMNHSHNVIKVCQPCHSLIHRHEPRRGRLDTVARRGSALPRGSDQRASPVQRERGGQQPGSGL